MKKNQYVRPEIESACIRPLKMISTSDVTSGKGIGYGGKDDNGGIIPATRRMDLMWNDDSEWE